MKIAFVRLPPTYADWYRQPLLGISYISACLEQKGFDCKIFDAYFHGWSERELLHHIIRYRPDVVGFTAMTHEITQSAKIARILKKELNRTGTSHAPIIVIGGAHISALPKKTLEEFPVFDYGIYGEGEKTTVELMEMLKQVASGDKVQYDGGGDRNSLNAIKGLVFRDSEGNVCVNESRPFLSSSELDALPYPAFHHYYGNNSRALGGKNSYYAIMATRGCPYNCAFCMRVLGRKVRCRSAENVFGEIEFAISRYGAHTFDFMDEIFLSPWEETQKLLQMIIKSGLSKRIRWTGLTRANFVTEDIIRLAKESGCFSLEMGIESGDDAILKSIGKGITVQQVRRAVEIIKKYDIPLKTFYILGHPNETMQTLQKTVNLAIELNTDSIAVGMMVPYPGTKIYDMAQQGKGGYCLLTSDWSEYDKYGGRVLEVKGLPYKEMAKWQVLAFIKLYLKHFRVISFLKYIWEKRRAVYFLSKKQFKRFKLFKWLR